MLRNGRSWVLVGSVGLAIAAGAAAVVALVLLPGASSDALDAPEEVEGDPRALLDQEPTSDTLPSRIPDSVSEEERMLRSHWRADQARVILAEAADQLLECAADYRETFVEEGQWNVSLRIESPAPGERADRVFVEERSRIILGEDALACIEAVLRPERFPAPVDVDGETLEGRRFYRIAVPIEVR